ncbi:MAG: hypothetical protein IJ630_11830, partial [Treponema sp.]|nr:hypothetical protein [Treponema sp.]
MALIRRRSAAKSEENAATENPQLELDLQQPENQTPASPAEATEEKPVKVVRRRRVSVKAEGQNEANPEQAEKQPESYASASPDYSE